MLSTVISFYISLGASFISLFFGRLYKPQNPPLRNLSNQTAVVTGANSGLGLAIAVALTKQGASVYLACRNPDRGAAAIEHVVSQAGEASRDRVFCWIVDVGDLSSVREFCERWKKDGGRKIDMLVHNAGIVTPPPGGPWINKDGLEVMYTTNFLGSFLMTYLLEDSLSPTARVVLTTSTGHYSGKLASSGESAAAAKKEREAEKAPVSFEAAYTRAKLQQVIFTELLQRHFASSPGSQRSAHTFTPGFTLTAIFAPLKKNWREDVAFTLFKQTGNILALDPSEGSKTGWWLASCGGEIQGGRYWERMNQRTSLADILSEETKKREWRRWEEDAEIVWDRT